MKKIIGLIISGILILVLLLSNKSVDSQETFLQEELAEARDYFPYLDSINTEVSSVDVAWHLDHLLKVINSIYDSLEASNPEGYNWNMNVVRTAVFTTGKMPRGRGKAPSSVLPPEDVKVEDLEDQMKKALIRVGKIDELAEKSYFNHPVFDMLDRNDAKRFMIIHTKHHMSIIKDILNTSND